jgi:hypothetical protein
MKIVSCLGMAAIAATALVGGASAKSNYIRNWTSESFLPPAQDVVVSGIHVACDGVGTNERENPRWDTYSLRLSFAGDGGQYLGNEHIEVTGHGHDIAMRCEGPWAMLDLPAGTYHVVANVDQIGSRNFTAQVSAQGQTKIVVRFPGAGGLIASNEPPQQEAAR